MYGSNVEYLNVYVAYGSEQFGQLGELYFQKSGTQGPRWVQTKMNVGYDHGDELYKIRIVGIVDEDYKGEMSLDDIFSVSRICLHKRIKAHSLRPPLPPRA